MLAQWTQNTTRAAIVAAIDFDMIAHVVANAAVVVFQKVLLSSEDISMAKKKKKNSYLLHLLFKK